MKTRSTTNAKRLAEASRSMGILSFGLLVLPILILLYARFSGRYTDFAQTLSFGVLATFLMLGSLVVGTPGCITAMIVLGTTMDQGGDNRAKKIAITGLILSGLGVSVVSFLFIYLRFFR
ncbi:MAG TPA: hypothetical protein VN843_32595 [Anaerolineales bacterium]|nr:hypothetical protein [Anaerolineales bacterium]